MTDKQTESEIERERVCQQKRETERERVIKKRETESVSG